MKLLFLEDNYKKQKVFKHHNIKRYVRMTDRAYKRILKGNHAYLNDQERDEILLKIREALQKGYDALKAIKDAPDLEEILQQEAIAEWVYKGSITPESPFDEVMQTLLEDIDHLTEILQQPQESIEINSNKNRNEFQSPMTTEALLTRNQRISAFLKRQHSDIM